MANSNNNGNNTRHLCVVPTVFNCWPIENWMVEKGRGTVPNDNSIEDILWPCTVGSVITVSRYLLRSIVYRRLLRSMEGTVFPAKLDCKFCDPTSE